MRQMSEMTTEILEQNLGKVVLVRLRGGKSLRGRLKGFDQHLNLVLEETDDTSDIENTKKLGLIIVRGDNVVLISPPPRWLFWEAVHHLLENDQVKLFIFAVDDVEDAHIMYAKRDALPVDMEKVLQLENIVGRLKLFKDKE